MENTTTIKRVSPSQAAKNRVKAVKKTLPLAWREIFFEHYPQFKEGVLRRRLENVFALNSTDIFITEVLEKIASGEIKNNNSV
jgi:hypothetical protein